MPIADLDGELKERVELQTPKMYRVIMLNDDYTTMDFVIHVLMDVFHMPENTAVEVMIDVHKKGKGVCGTYTREVAQTKTNKVHRMAKEASYPLRCTMEPVE